MSEPDVNGRYTPGRCFRHTQGVTAMDGSDPRVSQLRGGDTSTSMIPLEVWMPTSSHGWEWIELSTGKLYEGLSLLLISCYQKPRMDTNEFQWWIPTLGNGRDCRSNLVVFNELIEAVITQKRR
jgi:hypothetical protein